MPIENSKKPTVFIMVGLPRSGKSTYVEQYKGLRAIISADQLRYIVYGQRFWGPGEDMMWTVRKIAFKDAHWTGYDIMIDDKHTASRRNQL